MTYSHMANATLPLARSGFTSEFGKGSGGSHSLWSPDYSVGSSRSRATAEVCQVSLSPERLRYRRTESSSWYN